MTSRYGDTWACGLAQRRNISSCFAAGASSVGRHQQPDSAAGRTRKPAIVWIDGVHPLTVARLTAKPVASERRLIAVYNLTVVSPLAAGSGHVDRPKERSPTKLAPAAIPLSALSRRETALYAANQY